MAPFLNIFSNFYLIKQSASFLFWETYLDNKKAAHKTVLEYRPEISIHSNSMHVSSIPRPNILGH